MSSATPQSFKHSYMKKNEDRHRRDYLVKRNKQKPYTI